MRGGYSVLIVLLFCLVVVGGLLSFGVTVWFGAAMEEGWDKPTVFNICGFGQKMIFGHQFSRSYEESVYAQFKGKFKH